MPGSTAWQQRKVPRTFTSISRHHSDGSYSQVTPLCPPAPALFTSRSIGAELLFDEFQCRHHGLRVRHVEAHGESIRLFGQRFEFVR